MTLVTALSARWGVETAEPGKVVWAEITADTGTVDADAAGIHTAGAGTAGAGTAGTGAGGTGAGGAGAGGIEVTGARAVPEAPAGQPAPPVQAVPRSPSDLAVYTVVLGDVPTDLLLAAKNHVDGLVREFTLAESGAASGATEAIPPHLAHLLSTVTTRFAVPREAIKRQALAAAAAGRERTRLELTLPLDAADAGEEYLAALEEIESYARAARLLTVESPSQHLAFRRWYVGALVDQLRRAGRGEAPAPARSFEQYLLDALDVVVSAQRTTERAARLQRVTAALAEATTPAQVAEVVLSEGVAAMGAGGGALLVPGGDGRLAVQGSVGYDAELVAHLVTERLDEQLPAADALRRGTAVWLESRQERDLNYPALSRVEPGAAAMCVLPLLFGHRVLGVLRFSFDHPRLFDRTERAFVRGLADQTALALERARLFAAERQARERSAFLAAATKNLASSLDQSRILANLVDLLVPAHADWAAARLVEDSAAGGEPAPPGAPGVVVVAPRQGREGRGVPAGPPPLPPPAGRRGMSEALRTGRTTRRAGGGVLAIPVDIGGRAVAVIALGRGSGRPYGAGEQELFEELAARAAIALGNARQYEHERRTALTLQRSLLPQRLPEVPGLAFAWRYLPGSAGALVGGDWYDVLPLDDGRVALVIGDVMGHGIHAAATMGQLRATARTWAAGNPAPADVLGRLDMTVSRLEQGRITTAVFAVLDPATGLLTIASAGHLPPLVVPPRGGAYFVPLDPGPPLSAGLPEYTETELVLEPGSTLLFFTDGLIEDRARPVDEGMRMLQRQLHAADSPDQLCDRALVALGRATDNDDDVALLAVALAAPPAPQVTAA